MPDSPAETPVWQTNKGQAGAVLALLLIGITCLGMTYFALLGLVLDGETLDPFSHSYFLSRDIIVPDVGGGMPCWRDQLFSVMSRNASSAVEYFNIPANSVIELGSRVQI